MRAADGARRGDAGEDAVGTADIYARLSRYREESTSIERQVGDAQKLAEIKGFKVGKVHDTDVDLSGFDITVRRPGYEELWERVEQRATDAVIFWKIDRVARNAREFLRFVDHCEKHGVALISVNEPFDTTTPIGRAIVAILAVFAELESATIGLRVRSARAHAAKAGRYKGGGPRPWGYTRSMEIIPEEAEVIRDAAERILRGESLGSIVKEWNERGVPQPNRARVWRPGNLSKMIRRPHLAALNPHRGELFEGDWEPILDRAVYEALAASAKRQAPSRRSYFLSGGLIRCACGGKMVAHPANGKRRYWCSNEAGYTGCGKVSIDAEAAEDFMRDATFAALETPELRAALEEREAGDDSGRELLAALRLVEQRMEEAGREYAQGSIPMAALRAATDELERQATELRRRLETAGRQPVLTPGRDPAKEWEARDTEWKAKLVGAVWECVEVAPAARRTRWDDPKERLRPIPRP